MHFLGFTTSSDEVSRMMEELDSDKDGFFNLQYCILSKPFSFRHATLEKLRHVYVSMLYRGKQNCGDGGIRELKKAFKMFDEDGDGVISVGELHSMLTRLGDDCTRQDCEEMIKSVDGDGDGDGSLNFAEFKQMMTNNKK
ncbi:hypothetical protein LIER_13070 [Lithospermum erythrorhizon]|uniref:EF-hand domain-containing protein n=1 Tax=Lithospermum erythrorhizon TaxID=34254 RepID=A0AAV3PWK3_LITER